MTIIQQLQQLQQYNNTRGYEIDCCIVVIVVGNIWGNNGESYRRTCVLKAPAYCLNELVYK
jgi:hypothetical protein